MTSDTRDASTISCPHCGIEVPSTARFCFKCGLALYHTCPQCGQEAGVWMDFCSACGAPLDSHTPLDTGSSLRLATVLFADVKGYTAMSEKLSPEDVGEIMNRCFEVLSAPIVLYGGTIDKFVGDAVMARFGAPQAHEDDPVRAIHAALQMQRNLRDFAAELQASKGFGLQMRIGINTGPVLAGEIGSSAFKSFTLMGNTVNLASRLEHEAEPGSVLVGEATYRLAKHAFEFRAMPPLAIRGQSEPVSTFVPIAPKTAMADVSDAQRAARSPFVDRVHELDMLATYMREAAEGRGRLVGLIGDPGMGRSRLAEEFCSRQAGATRVYAAAPSYGESVPYSLLTGLIRSLLWPGGHAQDIQPAELAEAVAALVHEPHRSDALAIAAGMFDIRVEGATDLTNLDAASRQGMMASTLKILMAVRAHDAPLLLTIEDLHWADAASLAVLDQVLTGIGGWRIMLLVTHRPGFSHVWPCVTAYRQVYLGDLPREAAVEVLDAVFGSSRPTPEVRDMILDKAGGNPLFIEQMVSSLIESHMLLDRDGTWILAGDAQIVNVPDTIQEILLARLDRLPRRSREVLETASVIGRVFRYRVLASVIEAERALQEHLQVLQRQAFVHEKAIVPELEYSVRDSLTYDFVYNNLLRAHRQELHERVARVLEELDLAQGAERTQLLAMHYEQTENRDKALEYALRAAEDARALYANQEAIAHYEQALDLLKREEQVDPGQHLDVLEALAGLLALVARANDARQRYEEAMKLATTGSDRARLWRKLGDIEQSWGRFGRALTDYEEGERALAGEENAREQAALLLARARMDRSRGAVQSAFRLCSRALASSSELDPATNAMLYYELGRIEQLRGNGRSAAGYLAAAARQWREAGALDRLAMVIRAEAEQLRDRGDLSGALARLREAEDLQRRVFDRHGLALTLFDLARVAHSRGELEAALAHANEALTIATETDNQWLAADCGLQIGALLLEQGNVEGAQESIEPAYAMLKQLRNWKGVANGMLVRARLFAARGDVQRAHGVLEKASGLAHEMGDKHLQAELAIAEAELELDAPDLDAAAGHAGEAVRLGRELGNPVLVARAERALGSTYAHQGRRREALDLLAGSVDTLQRNGFLLQAAYAALDYGRVALQANGALGEALAPMLESAARTFERCGLSRRQQEAHTMTRSGAAR